MKPNGGASEALPASCKMRPHSLMAKPTAAPNAHKSKEFGPAAAATTAGVVAPAKLAPTSTVHRSSSPPRAHHAAPSPSNVVSAKQSIVAAGTLTRATGAVPSAPPSTAGAIVRSPSPVHSPSRTAQGRNDASGALDHDNSHMVSATSTSALVLADVTFSFDTPGVKVSDYIVPVTDLKRAVQQSELDYPDLQLLTGDITIAHGASGTLSFPLAKAIDSDFLPGAVGFEIVELDATFFSKTPVIDANGILIVDLDNGTTGRKGITSLRFRAVDYASLNEATMSFNTSRVETVQVNFVAIPIAKRRLVGELQRSHQMMMHHASNATDADAHGSEDVAEAAAPSGSVSVATTLTATTLPSVRRKPGVGFGVRPLCIHTFRREPARITPSLVCQAFIRGQPLALLKLCTYSVERELLSSSQAREGEKDALLEQIRSAMDLRTPIDTIIPIIDKAARLHFGLGGDANLATAERLALLRIQLMSAALSIDLGAENLDSVVALRLASAKPQTVQLYIRVLVEGAHLYKFLSKFKYALKFYRLASTVTTICNKSTGNRKGASLVPFFVAIGDVHLMMGDHAAALEHYERARAFAEMSGGGTVLAECEDLIAVAYALMDQHEQAQQAVARSLRIRKDVSNPWSTAETYLVQSFCFMAKDAREQALSSVLHAIDLLENGFGAGPSPSSPTTGGAAASKRGAAARSSPAASGGSPLLTASGYSASGSASSPVVGNSGGDGAAPTGAALLLKTAAYTMCAWVQMSGVATKDVSDLFSAAVAVCVRVCGQHCWELTVPTWVWEAYELRDGSRFSAVHGVHTHYSGTDSIGGCFMALVAALHEVTGEQHSATSPTSEAARTEAVSAAVAWLESNLAEGSPLRLVAAEMEAFILAAHGDVAAAASGPLTRVFSLWHASLPNVKQNASLPYRLCNLAAKIYTELLYISSPTPTTTSSISSGGSGGSGGGSGGGVTVAECVEDGVARMLMNRSEPNEFAPAVVPLLLDAAEVEFASGDFATALDLFGKALRITDNRNLLYLLGALYKPSALLTAVECNDRNRLLAERGMNPHTLESLATLMLQIAHVHEIAGDLPQATAVYQQSYATLEMGRLEHHPAALEALNGAARTVMKRGELGDALTYVQQANDVFFTFHYKFGAYRDDALTVQVRENLLRTERALRKAFANENFALVEHVHKNPSVHVSVMA